MEKQNIYKHLLAQSIDDLSAFQWMVTAKDFKMELDRVVKYTVKNHKLKAILNVLKDKEDNISTFTNLINNFHDNLSNDFQKVSKQVIANLITARYGEEMMLLEREPGKFETYLTSNGKFVTICNESPFVRPEDSKLMIKDSLLDKLTKMISWGNNSSHSTLDFFRNNGRSVFFSDLKGYKEIQLKLQNQVSQNHQENELSVLIKSRHKELSTRQLIQELMAFCKDKNLAHRDLTKTVLRAIHKEDLLDETMFIDKAHHFEKVKISDFIKNYGFDAKVHKFYHIEDNNPRIKLKIMFAANKEPQNHHTIIFPGEHGYQKLLKHTNKHQY
jgi:hypothetical protein